MTGSTFTVLLPLQPANPQLASPPSTLAGHLIAVLKKNGVAQADIDDLVKIVASTRGDIVEKSKN